MLAAFVLGLTGSLSHCVGMCSGVTLLLSRRGAGDGPRLWLAHLGRLTTYSLLGGLAGLLGSGLLALSGAGDAVMPAATGPLNLLQGMVALVAALATLYMALAFLGRLPSPERLLLGFTRRWGRLMRQLTQNAGSSTPHPLANAASPYLLGLLWGLLPCGLVMAGLLLAAATGHAASGALTMLAFGLGTGPALLGLAWLSGRRSGRQPFPWLHQVAARHLAASLLVLFSTQLALRGLAIWGWVDHLRLAGVVLW